MSSNLALDQRFNFSDEQLPCISIFARFFLSFIVISLSLIIANQQHIQQSIQRIIVITTGDGHLEFWQGLGIWALSGHLDTTTVSKPSHLLYTTPQHTTPQHTTPLLFCCMWTLVKYTYYFSLRWL